MMNINGDNGGTPNYMEVGGTVYTYSIVLTFNGLITPYEKIITSLFTFDMSNNAFEGDIPYNIGDLVATHGLNLSHNLLSGSIPPSISNLTLLNCLDLSHNMLTGHIPQELVRLTSMGVFNVSENQLVGPIPHGKQFDTFGANSYQGNLELCGFPLLECGNDGKRKLEPLTLGSDDDDDSDEEGIFMLCEWKVVVLGYACGTIVGLAWGYYMLSVGRLFWLVKCVDKILVVFGFYEPRFGTRGRRAQRPRRN